MTILVTCVVVGLVLMVIHWLPWAKLIRGQLPRWIEFCLNMAGVAMPVTITISWSRSDAKESVFVIWSAIVTGALAVFIGYLVDDWALHRSRAFEAEARERLSNQQLMDEVERRR